MMIRTLSAIASLSMLAACGGGEQPATIVEDDAATPGAARSYAGDNLTSIDAAANDASLQPLAPDTPVDVPAAGNDGAAANAMAAE